MTTLIDGMPTSKKHRGKGKRGGEVIHVAFGPGGGRIQHADAPKAGASGHATRTNGTPTPSQREGDVLVQRRLPYAAAAEHRRTGD